MLLFERNVLWVYFMEFAFLQDAWNDISNETAEHHVMVWNFLYYINSYPVSLVKYIYIVSKHYGQSLMLSFLLSCDSAEIINMQPI